ncbi:Acetyltransferase [Spraguea lophii 42_110]|uniref:Acetyltransferase n=1 Tax=Spraguea lophii (strain 42_110) TaxID=1358809 RepID=S7WCD5_SPRLO|nr:Acetyltransferase [Spraguea lophii 42_110]
MIITIRNMLYTDIYAVRRINIFILPENYELLFYKDLILEYPEYSFVVELEDVGIVGYILAKLETDVIHLLSFAILKEYRCLGIGKMLMNVFIDEMIHLDEASEIYLNVRTNNKRALKLYTEVFKFKIIEEVKDYYEDGSNCFSMKKILVK